MEDDAPSWLKILFQTKIDTLDLRNKINMVVLGLSTWNKTDATQQHWGLTCVFYWDCIIHVVL